MGSHLPRRAAGLAAAVCLLVTGGASSAVALAEPASPEVGASSAILMDVATGQVLWARNPEQPRAVASATKIITAILVLELADLDEAVQVSSSVTAVSGNGGAATLGLSVGEVLTVEELLYAMMLHSANDAAVALAEHVAGSTEAFVEAMNRRTVELGATHSRFRNPHGLDEDRHYSTALDLARLTRTALSLGSFRRVVSTDSYRLERASGVRVLSNRNPLLTTYPGATGVKTGTTEEAGRVLVASASRGVEERIAVVLDSPNPEADAAALLDYGLSEFRTRRVLESGRLWGYVTFGDGRTSEIHTSEELEVVLPSRDPDPTVTFEARRRVLLVQVGPATMEAEVELICEGGPCPESVASERFNAVAWLWQALAPAARLLDDLIPPI